MAGEERRGEGVPARVLPRAGASPWSLCGCTLGSGVRELSPEVSVLGVQYEKGV